MIAEQMKGRTQSQCWHHWASIDPDVSREAWTLEEDEKLTELFKKYGPKWKTIADEIKNRNDLQCQDRWRRQLTRETKLRTWTPEEDTNLIELIKIHGLKWVEIAKHMKGRNDTQCSQRWHFTLDPKIIKGSWTPEEDENLRQMVKKYGSKWSIIAQNMGNRTSLQCRRRWNCKLNKTNNNELKRDWTPEEDKKLLELVKEHGYNRKKISENMNKRSYTDSLWRYNFHLNPNIRKGKWTPNEDKMLIELVEKFGTRWGKIAECMKVRSCYQCCTRWNRILRPDNKPWTPKEDQKLKKLVKVYGLNWEKISENMDDRTSFQCRKRWSEYVDPKIIRQKWSRKEDKQLINLVRKFGTKWTKVSNLMNGRTNKQCIRRWRKIIELKNESFVESSEMFSYYDNQSEDETSQQAIDSDYDSDATIIDIPN
ncbi:Myb- protein B [Blomia tropicalis]|nr:Myb- protein B [Blomia tropicalis]